MKWQCAWVSVAMSSRPEGKVGSGSDESVKVQEDLAGRMGKIADDQMTDAMQRQVGATPANWTEEDEATDAPDDPSSDEQEEAKTDARPVSGFFRSDGQERRLRVPLE